MKVKRCRGNECVVSRQAKKDICCASCTIFDECEAPCPHNPHKCDFMYETEGEEDE